jgi:NAD(P)-dependent dehydrogenase (short-subunit alcohol dehydrogenase family)
VVALITGSAKRIGRFMALYFARQGYDIMLHARSNCSEVLSVQQEILAMGRRAEICLVDLSDSNHRILLIDLCFSTFGRLDVLINNASIFDYDNPLSFNSSLLSCHFRVNTEAPLDLARLYFNYLQDSDRGVVIHLLDQKIQNLNPDFFSYTLSKIALERSIPMCASFYAPKLRIVGLAPGLTLPSGEQTEENFEKMHAHVPLGRSSTPEDLAQAAYFLAQSSAITGHTLYVDGGQHLSPSPRDVMFLN